VDTKLDEPFWDLDSKLLFQIIHGDLNLKLIPTLVKRKNNYLFDKKKVKLLFNVVFSRAQNRRFITSAGGSKSDKTAVFSTRTKNKVEKRISCFIGHEVLFYETTFSASALEH
jgi:hypothetical protein